MVEARPGRRSQREPVRRGAAPRPPLRHIARALLDLRPREEWLLDRAPDSELGYRLLLEMIWQYPRRPSLAGLSEATGRPLTEVFRAVTVLARKGLIEFESDAPLLREHQVALTDLARGQIEQYLRHAGTALGELFERASSKTPSA